MATQTIDASIFVSSHPDIVKRISVSSLIFSGVLLLAGVLAFVSTMEIEEKSSAGSMSLMVLGAALFLFGIFRLLWKSKEVVYLPTGSLANEYRVFFDLKDLDKLKGIVTSNSYSVSSEIKSQAGGNVRLEIILSKDKKFAAVQLFQFIPYTYQPVTSVHYYTNEEASAFAAFLAKSK